MSLITPFWKARAAFKRRRWRWALGIALCSDALSFGLEFFSLGLAEIPQLAVDGLTAAALALVLGPRWSLALPLALEAIPGMAAFPTWALAVAALAAFEPLPEGDKRGDTPA